MFEVRFEATGLASLEELRRMQLQNLRGWVQDYIEEGIATYNANCFRITSSGEDMGYACIGTYGSYKDAVLEYFITDEYRSRAGEILSKLVKSFCCRGWFVNTQDSFSLPLLFESGYEFETDGYIFGIDNAKSISCEFGQGYSFEITGNSELEEVYKLIMQDGFYTGGGIETLEPRLPVQELYSLRQDGRLVGVGFASILKRTPQYADVAMIIDRDERHKGLGTLVVKSLVGECRLRGMIPTAVCSAGNKFSKRTLEAAGFHTEGCMLLARL